jgi:hypothetical protein
VKQPTAAQGVAFLRKEYYIKKDTVIAGESILAVVVR